MPSEVRYHRSSENIDDAERAIVKPLSVSYRRFSVLERVLMVAVFVFIVLVIVFGVLYASSGTSDKESELNSPLKNKTGKINDSNNCSKTKPSQVLSAQAKSILDSLDWSVDPCDDFYNFSCNKWSSENDIPPNMLGLNRFGTVWENTYAFLKRKLQDKDTIKKYENIGAVSKALDDYTACMQYVNVTESEKAEQARKIISDYGGWNISGSRWPNESWTFLPTLVKMHRNLRIFPFFHISVTEDIKNSTRYQIMMVQRISYLLRPEAYLGDDTSPNRRRKAYQDLMLTVMTTMANTSKNDPVVARQAKKIFELEKFFAEVALPSSQAANKEALYNPMTIKELQDATGNMFNWSDYFQGLFRDTGVSITTETIVNVNELDYIKNVTRKIGTTDDVILANYMIWELICQTYRYFPRVISQEFKNYSSSSYLPKTKPDQAKTCFQTVLYQLGLPLSMLYVDEKFGIDKLRHVEEMVTGIRDVYINNIEKISWMDPETKRVAMKKARSIKQNIGFPKILLDHDKLNEKYAELVIKKNDYFENVLSKRMFHMKNSLQNLQKPVDKSVWPLPPIYPNAYYKRTSNKIGFPAGLLQPPFFDISRPMSLNYGGIGMIIGHELTHSFDNTGRKYDENGNYLDWWKNISLMEFQKRTACLAKKYSKYFYYGFKVNGQITSDENIADNGGIKQAFQAYQTYSKQHYEPAVPLLNLTNNQLFFIGSAQIWCSKHRSSARQSRVRQNHSPSMIRVIGTLSNYPEFSKAFKCPVGSRMNPKEKCNIW